MINGSEIRFIFSFSGAEIVLPVNPINNFQWSRDGKNEITEVVGIGDINIPVKYGLAKASIESFFPGSGKTKPHEYKDKLMALWDRQKPIKFTIENMNQNSLLVLIDHFDWDRRAGEEEDLYYTLDISEYRPYGAKVINLNPDKETVQPQTEQRPTESKPATERTYTVVPGDSLWKITRKFSPDGVDWHPLYEANKQTIGDNANLIYPGQVLIIPESWVTA